MFIKALLNVNNVLYVPIIYMQKILSSKMPRVRIREYYFDAVTLFFIAYGKSAR